MAKNFLKLRRYQITVLGSSENIKQNKFKTKNNAPRFVYSQGFPGGLGVKNPSVMQEIAFDSWVGKIHLRRKSQPTVVFLPGKSHGQRNLANHCPWDRKRVGHDLVTEQQQTCLFILQKTNVIEKTLKAREKQTLLKKKHYNGPSINNQATMQARREWINTFKLLENMKKNPLSTKKSLKK